MGKRKIDNVKYIKDRSYRNVTFNKRKNGLIKKAIEISSLCGVNIFILIHDGERKRTV
jgi:hypothetical protein